MKTNMKGLLYQLKNIRRDKMCILSFFLPVVIGLAVSFMSDMSFSSISETSFGIIENSLPEHASEWLSDNGNVTEFPDKSTLHTAILEPKSQMIGVLWNGQKMTTLLAGDELQITTITANTLPTLFAQRHSIMPSKITILPTQKVDSGMKSLLLAITMITAMFLGCTFNAMNIIGEKEDGISLINEIMPFSKMDYLLQKISLGFAGGVLSTILTSLVCIKIIPSQIPALLVLIILSAFIAALAGLFIGQLASGLMTGIVYLKVVMILFIAPPIFFSIVAPSGGIAHTLSYLIPSSATFYSLLDLLNGKSQNMMNIIVLLLHCLVWTMLYLCLQNRKDGVTKSAPH